MMPATSTRNSQQKYPIAKGSKKEDPFSDFFECFHQDKNQRREVFTPYHLQENYRIRPSYEQTARPTPIRKQSAVVRRASIKHHLQQGSSSSWQLDKWETAQESQLNSFVAPAEEYS